MANKYYLNEVGLARLLDDLSLALANHTTSEIEFEEVVDPETGETVKRLVNPNNFISAQSIVDYLNNGNTLSVSQDIATPTSDGYSVTTNENGYATISDLSSGTYTMECSYSNNTLGYVADTIKTKVEIL